MGINPGTTHLTGPNPRTHLEYCAEFGCQHDVASGLQFSGHERLLTVQLIRKGETVRRTPGLETSTPTEPEPESGQTQSKKKKAYLSRRKLLKRVVAHQQRHPRLGWRAYGSLVDRSLVLQVDRPYGFLLLGVGEA